MGKYSNHSDRELYYDLASFTRQIENLKREVLEIRGEIRERDHRKQAEVEIPSSSQNESTTTV